jgi:hypothetical protein
MQVLIRESGKKEKITYSSDVFAYGSLYSRLPSKGEAPGVCEKEN